MFQNIVSWEGEWQHSQKLADGLRQSEKNGSIHRLCFMPGGRACFRSEEPAGKLLRNLSWQCEGKAIAHQWLDGDDCGSSLWQDGRESRYVPQRETPDWYSLSREVADKTETWEACADFHKKVDSCWESYISKLRELTLNQLDERSTEIAAAMLCYGQIRKLSWQKTWIEYLNQIEDPLAAVRDAMLTMLNTEAHEKFDAVMWELMGKADLEGGQPKEVGQEMG